MGGTITKKTIVRHPLLFVQLWGISKTIGFLFSKQNNFLDSVFKGF